MTGDLRPKYPRGWGEGVCTLTIALAAIINNQNPMIAMLLLVNR